MCQGILIGKGKLVINLTISSVDELHEWIDTLQSDECIDALLEGSEPHAPGEWREFSVIPDVNKEYTQYHLHVEYYKSDLDKDDHVPSDCIILRRYHGKFCYVLRLFSLSWEDFRKQIDAIVPMYSITEPLYTCQQAAATNSGGLIEYLPDVPRDRHSGKGWEFMNSMSVEPEEVRSNDS